MATFLFHLALIGGALFVAVALGTLWIYAAERFRHRHASFAVASREVSAATSGQDEEIQQSRLLELPGRTDFAGGFWRTIQWPGPS